MGYVVGLGDRHGENILLDRTNGDCVHVYVLLNNIRDLNCLFEKGLTFEIPETVPFRLTQNIVDAFGVTGVECVFRKSCEATLRVLRSNRESLMSVMETFIHDPLCEWSKPGRRLSTNLQPQTRHNDQAVKRLDAVDKKLMGLVNAKDIVLSVEAQVDELISQATDVKNLSRMYIGWAPYL